MLPPRWRRLPRARHHAAGRIAGQPERSHRDPAADPLTCEVAALPGTGSIVGKADQLLRLGPTDVVTPSQLVDAVEALPARPWPARFRATVHNGRTGLTLPASAVAGLGEAEAVRH